MKFGRSVLRGIIINKGSLLPLADDDTAKEIRELSLPDVMALTRLVP